MLIIDIKTGAPPSEPCRKAYNHLQLISYSQLCRENAGLIEGCDNDIDLTFDAEDHTYKYKEKQVPSVTWLLKPLFRGTKWVCSEEDMDRGTYIHRACEMNIQRLRGQGNCLDVEQMEIDYPGSPCQLDAFMDYLFDGNLMESALCSSECLIEYSMYSQEHGYAGTVDYIFSKIYPGRFVCRNVLLQRDGKYKIIEYPERDFKKDFRKFLPFLAVYSYTKNGI